MTRALVTGGCGFVGRHLCDRLLAEGFDVVCVDLMKPGTGARPPVSSQRLHRQFTLNEQDCRAFFESADEHFDYVFHLAALVGGRMTLENQTLLVAEDLAVDAALWRWAGECRPGTVVYFSSSAAYPVALQTEAMQTRLSEDMISFERPLGVPDLSYGWTKLTGEYLMKLYVERYGGRAVAYRPFSGYGEDQDLAYPFPAICSRLLKERGAPEVSVWGSGHQCRDFIHISDCVDFIWETMDALPSGASLNLSTGKATSFIALAELVSRELGWAPQVRGTANRPEGVFFRCGDVALQKSFGLTPKIGIEEGVRRCLEHHHRLEGACV
ncbi:NAD-dependent epimerase/dehydratase family protein [Rhizobium mongolense]|uniref:NAD-dependent epimerase/dehydratase family protein n=1 Tax=Rhizobium TaxID=379 RepID=UPI00188F244E|nr:NAD-dependent epimerase/dehydratase family protein [Rhizobium sp. 007]QPB22521.1 NAD-dependent epimerase/dehydratase family protein [Rhizobium sp. 007]